MTDELLPYALLATGLLAFFAGGMFAAHQLDLTVRAWLAGPISDTREEDPDDDDGEDEE
jgi:hypothetical protein